MNNKVNYTLVGLVVVLGLVMMAGFTYWLTKPTDELHVKVYSISFQESVLGLNIDAPVKYKGLSVGEVSTIRVSHIDDNAVEVLISILDTTPIKANTVAKLTAQGITGLSYINLSQSTKELKPLKHQSSEYESLHTEASFLTNLEESIDSVSLGITTTLSKTDKLLNDNNQEQVAQLLKNSAEMTNKLNTLLDEKTILHLQSTARNLDQLSHKLDNMTPNVDKFMAKSVVWEDSISNSLGSIMDSYLGIRLSMDEIKKAVANGDFNVKEISKDVLPTFNNTLIQMQELFIKVDDTLEKHNRSPNDILFKSQELKTAPGE